jgi:hypothetical protein
MKSLGNSPLADVSLRAINRPGTAIGNEC